MHLENKKIGIWGLGVVGTSVLNFLHKQKSIISVVEQKTTEEQKQFLSAQHIQIVDQHNIKTFFDNNDFVVASPGIDYTQFIIDQSKLLAELDLFAQHFKKLYIGISGSLGKTTVTTTLSNCLQKNNINLFTGGNIGTAALDALTHDYEQALLEVSSFQLEYAQQFAPDLAIITNFYPNHLDRHKTLENYFEAKCRMLKNQKAGQHALVPLALTEKLEQQEIKSTIHYFSTSKPPLQFRSHPFDCDLTVSAQGERPFVVSESSKSCSRIHTNGQSIFYIENNIVMHTHDGQTKQILCLDGISGFTENNLIVAAALYILNQNVETLKNCTTTIEHRLEYVATVNGVEFYNDSKSTVQESTLAAVKALQPKQIILLLGGISKGVDREPLLAQLKDKVVHIACFGKEAEILANYCVTQEIPHSQHQTLEQAFEKACATAQPRMCVLLSPSGASFDLFTDYKERGKRFKELIQEQQALLVLK